jgi:predicted ATPase
VLAALIDKSLVQAEHLSHEPPFGMLQTIRSYAYERLVASGEEQALTRGTPATIWRWPRKPCRT